MTSKVNLLWASSAPTWRVGGLSRDPLRGSLNGSYKVSIGLRVKSLGAKGFREQGLLGGSGDLVSRQ